MTLNKVKTKCKCDVCIVGEASSSLGMTDHKQNVTNSMSLCSKCLKKLKGKIIAE